MSDDEYLRLSEKGMDAAVEILARDGFLDEIEPTENVFENYSNLKVACDKYVAASVAKGSARSSEECRDAILVAYFQAYLVDVTRQVN
jgi:hypothetical protein